MKVDKSIAEKAEMIKKLEEEVWSYAKENLDMEGVNDIHVVDQPVGQEQGDGEYCDQTTIGEDWHRGTYYYPIEGSNKYLALDYDL